MVFEILSAVAIIIAGFAVNAANKSKKSADSAHALLTKVTKEHSESTKTLLAETAAAKEHAKLASDLVTKHAAAIQDSEKLTERSKSCACLKFDLGLLGDGKQTTFLVDFSKDAVFFSLPGNKAGQRELKFDQSQLSVESIGKVDCEHTGVAAKIISRKTVELTFDQAPKSVVVVSGIINVF